LNNYYKFENTPLPYAYNALEPHIDQRTMELHHDKHLQSYIDKLNETLKDDPWLQKLSLEQLIMDAGKLPAELQTLVRNYGGGVFNHRLFFNGMAGTRSEGPSGSLAEAIRAAYGSEEEFKLEFKQAALSVFGSGYAWLVTGKDGQVRILTTANQDTPLTPAICPVLTIDVWEHAYYLKYQNRRGEYIDQWFDVVDWKQAEQNYLSCLRWMRQGR